MEADRGRRGDVWRGRMGCEEVEKGWKEVMRGGRK